MQGPAREVIPKAERIAREGCMEGSFLNRRAEKSRLSRPVPVKGPGDVCMIAYEQRWYRGHSPFAGNCRGRF